MLNWLRSLLRRWLLDAPDELCFKEFVWAKQGDVPIMGTCRQPAGHFGPCDMG